MTKKLFLLYCWGYLYAGTLLSMLVLGGYGVYKFHNTALFVSPAEAFPAILGIGAVIFLYSFVCWRCKRISDEIDEIKGKR